MSGKKNYTRTEPGERIDHPDFDHTAVRSQLDADIQVPSEIILGGDASPRSAVVSGWSVSQPFGAPSIIEITPGVLLAGLRDAGEVKYGLIVANTEPKQISIDNIGNGSWGLWIRFDFVDAEVSNRIFWDAVLPTPTEVPRNIPTRRAQGWSEKIELQSQPDPGPEYVKIAEFTTAGGIVTAGSLVGVRDFLFEGREDLVASWGDTDDRSDNRATYGIQGLKRYAHAVNQQLQEIIGAALNQSASPNGNSEVAAAGGSTARWYRKAVKSLSQMLSLDGSRHMEGDLLPDDTANLRDLGNNADNRWGVFYGTDVNATDDVSAGDRVTAVNNIESFSGDVVVSTSTQEVLAPRFESTLDIASGALVEPNTLFQTNMVKAWANVFFDRVADTVTITDGFNIELGGASGLSPAAPNHEDFELAFSTTGVMADPNYGVWIQRFDSSQPLDLFPVEKTGTGFKIRVRQGSGEASGSYTPGLQIALNIIATTDIRFYVMVLGRQ